MADRQVRAVIMPPGPRLLELLEAALDGSGPAICPVSPGLPPAALKSLLNALRPTEIETPAGIEQPGEGRATSPSVAVLVATSGSSGSPKIAELTAEALTWSARASLDRLSAWRGRWLCCLPVSHVGGLQVLIRSLAAGTEPLIQSRFDMSATVESGAAHVSLVPTQLRRLVDARVDLSIFATILLGGAAASPGLLEAAARAGARIVRTYGMTETSGGCVYDRVPLDGVTAEVDSPAGAGPIRLAGPVLFSGYRLRPDLTEAALSGGWLLTNDIGRLENGRLRVLGRADEVINSGGEKVYPVSVERTLADHPAIKEVVVVGRPDGEWGERVTAVIVPADPLDPPSLDELRTFVRKSLPGFAAPRERSLVEAIPLLPSGKPDRAALQAGMS